MRIAFDLDNTLAPCGRAAFPIEPPGLAALVPFLRCQFPAGLRCGGRDLLRALRRQGHEIWVYTTSARSPASLWLWFLLQGVLLSGVVNGRRHERLVRSGDCPNCSKYPPAFGIDVLIDAADGVALEGLQHGFEVLRIDPDDPRWTERILTTLSGVAACPA